MAIVTASARPDRGQLRHASMPLLLVAIVAGGCPPPPPATACSSDDDCPAGRCDPNGHFCYLDGSKRDSGSEGGPGRDTGADLDANASDRSLDAGPGDAATDGAPADAACHRFGPLAQIAASNTATCALSAAGAVKCWGANVNGELGLGDTVKRGDSPDEMGCRLPPVDLGGRPAVAITGGANHFCVLLEDRTVRCWGYNLYGQLGQGDTLSRGNLPGQMGLALRAVDLGSDASVVQIAAGGSHSCALLASGAIKCWGRNNAGQLGLGDIKNRSDGLFDGGCTDAAEDAAGRDAAIDCEMGSRLPAAPVGATVDGGVTHLLAGASHSCVVLADGRLKCWGDNSYGQLGLGDNQARGDQRVDRPCDAGTGIDAQGYCEMGENLRHVQLDPSRDMATRNLFSCALLRDGQVRCWGYNFYGQLGIGDTVNRGIIPGDMTELPAVDLVPSGSTTHISVGNNHACAVLAGGSIKCWGWNYEGQLGQGDTIARGDEAGELGDLLPAVTLVANPTIRSIVSGSSHTCVLLSDDRGVRCWGYNVYGQLGLGDTNHRGDEPGEMGLRLPAVELGPP